MEVNDFKMMLIDVTIYLQHVQKLVFNVLIKDIQNEMADNHSFRANIINVFYLIIC